MKTDILRSTSVLFGFLVGSLLMQPLAANPTDGNVVSGSATITQTGNTVTVNQGSNTAIINWNSFSIANGETTRFNQPNSNSVALNRVIGNDASNIFGNLIANGKIILINPNGIMFGAASWVDVAGLIASTADIADADFLAGHYKFAQNPNKNAGIVNNGEISVKDEGLMALVAPGVENNGVIRANLGKVVLASGTEFTIVDTYGDGLITFATNSQTTQKAQTTDGRVMNDAVANHGTIIADGGTVLLTARSAGNVVDNVINMDGVIQANSVAQRNGQILLLGGDQGNVKVSGTFRAQGTQENKNGGLVETSGETFTFANSVSVDTRGYEDGKNGVWLIDPTNFTITAGSGVQTDSSIGADTLMANLATTDVTLQTANAGVEDGDIYVDAAVNWNSNSTLTLIADNNIYINAGITASNGGLTLQAGQNAQIQVTAGVGVANFKLQSGHWMQNLATMQALTALPTFSATQSFIINSGATFLRVAGGDGLDNPYQITDVYGLQGIGGFLARNFELVNDIDASVTAAWINNYGAGFMPISGTDIFSGTLDGQNYSINNLYIKAAKAGLFESNIGEIKNIKLANVTIVGSDEGSAGGIAGVNYGTISNSYVQGSIMGSATTSVGGIVGDNRGAIEDSYMTGIVTGGYTRGGIAGNNFGAIKNSHMTWTSSEGEVSGVAGSNWVEYGAVIINSSVGSAISTPTSIPDISPTVVSLPLVTTEPTTTTNTEAEVIKIISEESPQTATSESTPVATSTVANQPISSAAAINRPQLNGDKLIYPSKISVPETVLGEHDNDPMSNSPLNEVLIAAVATAAIAGVVGVAGGVTGATGVAETGGSSSSTRSTSFNSVYAVRRDSEDCSELRLIQN